MIRVIKLGGSLLQASVLPACLDVVEQMDGLKAVVPGGGLFAEQVRDAQRIYGFDDVVAHRMALLAMQQMALLFKGLKPGFSLSALIETSADLSGVSIWSPQPEELDSAGVAASWDITSDSLAAWLAAKLGADELILVKSADVSSGESWLALQEQGIVDVAFSGFAANVFCPITIINKDRFISQYD